jgi:hypothetical protein
MTRFSLQARGPRLLALSVAAAAVAVTVATVPGVAAAHGRNATRAAARPTVVVPAAAAGHRHASLAAPRATRREAAAVPRAARHARARATRPAVLSVPVCRLSVVRNGGRGSIRVFGQDRTNGLASLNVVNEVNDPVHVPMFPPGSTSRIHVMLRKDDPWAPSQVTLRFTNTIGAATTCTFTFLKVARGHPQTIGHLSPSDSLLVVTNFGLRSMVMRVNHTNQIVHLGQRGRLVSLGLGRHFNRVSNSLSFWGFQGTGDAMLVLWSGTGG